MQAAQPSARPEGCCWQTFQPNWRATNLIFAGPQKSCRRSCASSCVPHGPYCTSYPSDTSLACSLQRRLGNHILPIWLALHSGSWRARAGAISAFSRSMTAHRCQKQRQPLSWPSMASPMPRTEPWSLTCGRSDWGTEEKRLKPHGVNDQKLLHSAIPGVPLENRGSTHTAVDHRNRGESSSTDFGSAAGNGPASAAVRVTSLVTVASSMRA